MDSDVSTVKYIDNEIAQGKTERISNVLNASTEIKGEVSIKLSAEISVNKVKPSPCLKGDW